MEAEKGKGGGSDVEGAADAVVGKRVKGVKEKGFGRQGLWLGLDSRTGLDGGDIGGYEMAEQEKG